MAKAIGVHVFAGGFTHGVKRAFDVECQLESHGFGLETCEQVFDTPAVNRPNRDWPDLQADFIYGNPRCTGFSTITAGYGDACHGPWSKQTQDIHDLMGYAIGRADVIIWESVQQAFSVGRPLLDYLRDEVCKPNHYRVAHILMNASSFGNAQQRKRYFFVAYRDDRNFNIEPPQIGMTKPCTADWLWDLRERETRAAQLWARGAEYDGDCYCDLTPDEWAAVPHLPNGWDLNAMGRYAIDLLPPKMQRTWRFRTSDMPFSMHGIVRTNWLTPFPTIHSSAARFIHPSHNRPVTLLELSTIMGWDGRIPVGYQPVAQIAKGVVPSAGEWLAKQAMYYLNGAWGDQDWESSYDPHKGEWVGRDTHGQHEKIFNLTRYTSHVFKREDYPHVQLHEHRFDVERRRAQLARGDNAELPSGRHAGDDRV